MNPLLCYLLMQKMNKKEEEKKSSNEEKTKKKSKIIDRKTIDERTKTFEEARENLKQEFFGIDSVIDQVFDQIKTWYIYPEYMSRPTIINLWGLTGVGKTDFVKKLRMFLKVPSFCEIETDNTAESARRYEGYYHNNANSVIDEFANAEISTNKQSIILFDEIHRFRTLNEDKKLVPKTQYADIWKFLSDGALCDESYIIQVLEDEIQSLEQKYNSIQMNNVNNAKTFQEKILYVLGFPVQKSEEEKKNEEALKEKFLNDKGYIPYEVKKKMSSELDTFVNESNNIARVSKLSGWLNYDEEDFKKLKELQMTYQGIEESVINDIYMNNESISFVGTNEEQMKIWKLMKRSSSKVMLEFLKYIRNKLIQEKSNLTGAELRMRELDYVYSKALIFICGNIPKDLYKKNQNIVTKETVKTFLSDLFMPEQISRFGNTYIVYPVLDKEVYDEVAEKEIQIMEEKLNKDFDTDKVKFNSDEVKKKVFDNLSEDFIYNGVRPVYSEVQRVLSEQIPNMIIKIAEEKEKESK